MIRKNLLIVFIVCFSISIVCIQTLKADTGGFTVFVDYQLTKITNVTGFRWNPGSNVTLEIDSGDNGTIDYSGTKDVPGDGTVDFDLGNFPVAPGDLVRMFDNVDPSNTHVHNVFYLTIDSIDPTADVLMGKADTTGTLDGFINVMVFDPDPSSGPSKNVVTVGGWCIWVCIVLTISYHFARVGTRNGTHNASGSKAVD